MHPVNRLCTPIDVLNDDALLNIFYLYPKNIFGTYDDALSQHD